MLTSDRDKALRAEDFEAFALCVVELTKKKEAQPTTGRTDFGVGRRAHFKQPDINVTVGIDGRVYAGTPYAQTVLGITDNSGESIGVGTTTGATFTIGSSVQGEWTSTGLIIGTGNPTAVNKLDIWGAEAIGTGYAGVYPAPTSGLIVQGNVGIGTNNPGTNALQVNGTISATNIIGNGSGITGLGSVSTGSAICAKIPAIPSSGFGIPPAGSQPRITANR